MPICCCSCSNHVSQIQKVLDLYKVIKTPASPGALGSTGSPSSPSSPETSDSSDSPSSPSSPKSPDSRPRHEYAFTRKESGQHKQHLSTVSLATLDIPEYGHPQGMSYPSLSCIDMSVLDTTRDDKAQHAPATTTSTESCDNTSNCSLSNLNCPECHNQCCHQHLLAISDPTVLATPDPVLTEALRFARVTCEAADEAAQAAQTRRDEMAAVKRLLANTNKPPARYSNEIPEIFVNPEKLLSKLKPALAKKQPQTETCCDALPSASSPSSVATLLDDRHQTPFLPPSPPNLPIHLSAASFNCPASSGTGSGHHGVYGYFGRRRSTCGAGGSEPGQALPQPFSLSPSNSSLTTAIASMTSSTASMPKEVLAGLSPVPESSASATTTSTNPSPTNQQLLSVPGVPHHHRYSTEVPARIHLSHLHSVPSSCTPSPACSARPSAQNLASLAPSPFPSQPSSPTRPHHLNQSQTNNPHSLNHAPSHNLNHNPHNHTAHQSFPQPPKYPLTNVVDSLDPDTLHYRPSHSTLNHLVTAHIKGNILAAACTTRYKQKYLTQILYRPM